MRRINSLRIVVIIATLAAASVAAVAQNQNQTQQNQSSQNQTQQTQTQQTQTQQKKKSLWQKLKDSAQQGTNAAQNTIQQGTNAVQNGSQQVQNTAQQGMQGIQQNAQGVVPATQGSGASSGNGGGNGSCGPSCFDAGPFQANVQQMTMSQQGAWHVIRMNIQFHNSTNQPLIIAYHEGSMVMVDNNGSTYGPAGGQPGELQGMGIDRGNQTDSQFVLSPGQTGNALFSTARWRDNTSPVGTNYSYNLTIDELQAQNGAIAIPVRTYNLNFPSLAPGTSNTAGFPARSTGNGIGTGNGGATYTGTNKAVPATQGNLQTTAASAQQKTASPAAQQRVVNGRPIATPPPSTASNNGAIKSTAVATPKPSPAVKASPTTTKKPATTNNQPNSTTANK